MPSENEDAADAVVLTAILLAAGEGNRMRPLTAERPKCLLPFEDSTILDRLILELQECGVDNYIVVTGHCADLVTEHLKYLGDKVRFVHNAEFSSTNNIVSLRLALDVLPAESDAILVETDLILEPGTLKRALAEKDGNVALVSPYQLGMDGTVVELDGDRILQVIPPHLQPAGFVYRDKFKTLNIYRFEREFLNGELRMFLGHHAENISTSSYYEVVLGQLTYIGRTRLAAVVVEPTSWAEVDDPNDLLVARYNFSTVETKLNILEGVKGGFWQFPVTDFAFIRNMYFPSPDVFAMLQDYLPSLLQNYGSSQRVLNEKLSYWLRCEPEAVVVLNGASQVYPILATMFSGARFGLPTPAFGEYSGRLRSESSLEYGEVLSDCETSLEDIAGVADVVVVVNPGNPLGTVRDPRTLLELFAAYPLTTFIVDESFIDFSPGDSIERVVLEQGIQNVLVLKSLSKTLGVPGLRLGYAATANVAIRDEIMSQIPIWNLNSIAELMLEVLLKHRVAFEDSIRATIDDRERLISDLLETPCVDTVLPSGANFVFATLNTDALQLQQRLLADHSIFIKVENGRRGIPAGDYVRIAVRDLVDNTLLVRALS